MAKMVISLVLENEDTVLKVIKNDIISKYANSIVSVSTGTIEEPKKIIEVPPCFIQ